MKITRRQFVQARAVAGASALLTACGGSSGSTAGSGAASAAGGSFNLKLGHNLAEDHAVHIQLTSFAEQVKEKTGGSINIQIIPNGTLGSESDMISQIQAGALDMAKVSASTLGNFSEKYNAFSVPYVFNDQAHYYSYMDSDSAKAVFESTDDQGFNAAPDLQIMGISACLAGAVCGDHCSPISDTTIMASAGANCNHIDHVSTQIPYAVTVAAICFVNYILAAFIRNVVISLAIGVVMVIGTLLVIRSVQSRKTA